ncbi:MAG: hypothetical protein H5U38_13865 [Calditrichaeota bacterium]|nr:hypothetical protein [Calditrichota bacterium]
MKRHSTKALVSVMLSAVTWSAAIAGGEIHLAAIPSRPEVGQEFRIVAWAKGFPRLVGVDLRLVIDALAVQVHGVEPAALRRFDWVRWKTATDPGPAVTALMLSKQHTGVALVDGDTLVVLRCLRVGAQGSSVGLRSGYPVAIDEALREVSCTVFPAAIAQATSVEEEAEATDLFGAAAFPNPCKGTVALRVTGVPAAGSARWCLYDALGRLVWEQEGPVTTGATRLLWHGVDAAGQPLPAGTYFYRLRIGARELRGKCVLLR